MPTNTYRRVKSVFEQTWRDYYEWSAPATSPLDLAKITNSLAQDPSFLIFQQNEAENSQSEATTDDNFPTQVTETHTQLVQSSRGAKHSTKSSNLSASTGSSMLFLASARTIPRYAFCLPIPRSVVVPDESRSPFIPILSDDIDVDFPIAEYQSLYGGRVAASEVGRDPSVDIICVETRSRSSSQGIKEVDIDATRILPFECSAIHAFDLERDLPVFPTQPSTLWSTTIDDVSCRSWQGPLTVAEEEDSDRSWQEMDEVFCRDSACHDYACTVHLGCGHIVTNRVRPKPNPVESEQSRKRCSRMCYKAVTAGPASWQESERQVLWSAYESGLTSSCDLRHVVAKKSCAEIGAELEKGIPESTADLSIGSFKAGERARTMKPRSAGCSCGNVRPGRGCVPKSCECAREGRECDPSTCRACSIRSRLGRETDPGCGNQRWLTGQHGTLRVGISAISGYGSFANETIEKDQALGGVFSDYGLSIQEYVGEVISDDEAEKRGTIYDIIRSSYLFEIPRTASLDAAKVGNLTRFINNGAGALANCGPRLSRFGKDQKIVLYATRRVKKGEEFSFSYGEKFHSLERSDESAAVSDYSTGITTPA